MVIVICIAALVVVVVLGIYRIHVTHQQEVKLEETAKEADVTWDDSALTITVNPMEVGGFKRGRKSGRGLELTGLYTNVLSTPVTHLILISP